MHSASENSMDATITAVNEEVLKAFPCCWDKGFDSARHLHFRDDSCRGRNSVIQFK